MHVLFMCFRVGDPELTEIEKQNIEAERADRSIFIQELLLSSMSENLRLSDDSTSNTSFSDSEENTLNFMNSDDDGELGNEKQGTPGLSKRSAKQQDQTSHGGGGGGASTATRGNATAGKSSPSNTMPTVGNVESSNHPQGVNSNVNSNCVSDDSKDGVVGTSTATLSSATGTSAAASSSSACLVTKEKVLSKTKPQLEDSGAGLEKGTPVSNVSVAQH